MVDVFRRRGPKKMYHDGYMACGIDLERKELRRDLASLASSCSVFFPAAYSVKTLTQTTSSLRVPGIISVAYIVTKLITAPRAPWKQLVCLRYGLAQCSNNFLDVRFLYKVST